MKKIISLILVLCTFVGVMAIPAQAASASLPKVSASNYIKGYPIKTTSKITVYTNAACTKKNSYEYIDGSSDECWIVGYNSTYNSLSVSYPTATGRKTRYVPANVFFPTGVEVSDKVLVMTAPAKITTYKRITGSSTYGYIGAGERFYALGIQGSANRTCVIYHLDAGGYKIAWVKTSALASAAASNTSSNTNTTGSYSISNNVLTLNGVRLSEYPIGSKYTSSRYVYIDGTSYDTYGWQCCGFARYVQLKLYGVHEKNAEKKFTNICSKDYKHSELSTSLLKELITRGGVGAHLRTLPNSAGTAHSMIVTSITSTGFSVVDANSDGALTVKHRTYYTWSSYLSSEYGSRGIDYIMKYTG